VPPGAVGLEQDLRVAPRAEDPAFSLEPLTQLTEVVDLAVEDDPEPAGHAAPRVSSPRLARPGGASARPASRRRTTSRPGALDSKPRRHPGPAGAAPSAEPASLEMY